MKKVQGDFEATDGMNEFLLLLFTAICSLNLGIVRDGFRVSTRTRDDSIDTHLAFGNCHEQNRIKGTLRGLFWK